MDLYAPAYTLLHILAALLTGIIIGRITAGSSDPRRREARKAQHRAEVISTRGHASRLSPELRASTEALVANGQNIEAIRDVRQVTGLGLKEAKDVVKLIQEQTSRGARAPN